MLHPLAFVLALLSDDQVRVLALEDIVDDVGLVDFEQVLLQLVHERVVELVHVHLHSGVDGLPLHYETLAEPLDGVDLSVGVPQVGEYFLQLVGHVLTSLNLLGVHIQEGVSELLDVVELLHEGVDVAGGGQVFEAHLCVVLSFLEAFDEPLALLPPGRLD